jgi:DNA-binding SARP family transcriptional activator
MKPGIVRIALFGQPRVTSDDGLRHFPLPRKTLNVLGYLILKNKRPPTRDAIAFALFPDEEEEQARNSLRRNLSYLLSSLPPADGGEPFINADAERVAWNPAAPAHVDVLAFERAIAAGRDDDALAEYAGPLLPTLYDEWTTADRERLREAANGALARVIARERSLRRFDTATAAARRLLEDDPWREDIVRELMSVRYEAGDRAGALATFAQFSSRMRDEMSIEPMSETSALREAILRGGRLATSEPAPEAQSSDAAALPFVGREEAMALAIGRWHASADGRAGALFVAGEAGIGKSRFAAELARSIEREGGVTVIGETAAGGERRPYEAVIGALRYARHALVEQILDEHSHVTLSDDRSARARLYGSILQAVRELARARPLTVVLEDLHWAGPATIDLIGYLVERLATAPVLVVCTYRADELPRPHSLRALVRDVEGSGRATQIGLNRLAAGDATLAMRAVASPNLGDDALERAVVWSAGVPLLLSEAMRDLTAGREFSGGDFLSVIGERLARLASEAETALTYAAVLGARFELETLAAATGWRDDEIVDALGPSMELGLIRAGTRSRGLTFTFSHHVIHAAVLARIAEPDRIRVHALVARALRTLFSGGDRALEIAQHYAAAGDARRAAEQYAAGARHALEVFANVDARDAATAGLALTAAVDTDRELRYDLIATRERALARMGAPAERRADAELLCELAANDDSRACDALERLIEALRGDKPAQKLALSRLELLGHTFERAAGSFERMVATEALSDGDHQTASASALRAAQHFDALADRDAALRARMIHVNALVFLGEGNAGAEVIADLRPVAEACTDLSLRMEFFYAASSTGAGGRWDIALADAERSLELALLIGDRFGEAGARHNLGWAAAFIGDTDRSIGEYQRAIQAYSDVGNPAATVASMLNLAAARGWAGDYDGAFRLLDEVEALALDLPWVHLQQHAHRGSLWLRAGDLQRAGRYLRSAREHALRLGTAPYAAHIQVCFAELAARRGDLRQARIEVDLAKAALDRLELPVWAAELQGLSARVHAEAQEATAARAAIAAAVAVTAAPLGLDLSAKSWWDLAAANALLGDTLGAHEFAERAARVFCDEALAMPPDLAEMSGTLPWHVATFAFLAGREVSLTLAG